MYRTISICILFFFALHLSPFAQCADCTPPEDVKVDFCFDHEEIPNKCAWFSEKSETFILYRSDQKKNKMMTISLPEENQKMIPFLIKLSDENKKSLKAADILFLQAALTKWETQKAMLGFEMTASGLGVKMLKKGDGKLPEKGKNVSVHYHGYLENGKTFDNSFDRGEPISFPLGVGRVIKGWDEGIMLLPVGSEAILRIPAELGYGSRGAGAAIPPNSLLFFKVQVVSAD